MCVDWRIMVGKRAVNGVMMTCGNNLLQQPVWPGMPACCRLPVAVRAGMRALAHLACAGNTTPPLHAVSATARATTTPFSLHAAVAAPTPALLPPTCACLPACTCAVPARLRHYLPRLCCSYACASSSTTSWWHAWLALFFSPLFRQITIVTMAWQWRGGLPPHALPPSLCHLSPSTTSPAKKEENEAPRLFARLSSSLSLEKGKYIASL